jgi:hypothetical protein
MKKHVWLSRTMLALFVVAIFNVTADGAGWAAWTALTVTTGMMIVVIVMVNVVRIERKLRRYYLRGIRRGHREAIAAAVQVETEDAFERLLSDAHDAQSWKDNGERRSIPDAIAAFTV